VTLRSRFIGYLLVLHLPFAGLAVVLLLRNRLWLLAVEAAFLLSLSWGLRLVHRLFGTLDVLRSGAQLLNDSDFQSRFHETGQTELDALVRVYNRMADHLREERTQLQEQHYLLARILAVSPSGIAILDFDGRIDFVNAAAERLLGLTAEALRGRALADVDAPLARELAALAPGEARVVALWGGRRVKCHRGSFVDRGFPRSFLLLEELTEELRASEKAAYGKLIRMMSHEINNSVGAVGSLLDSFRGYAPDLGEEDRSDFLQAITVAVTRLENLRAFMNGFAEVVRLPPPDRRPTDVKQLVDEILILLRPELDRRRIAVRWETSEPVLPIELDRNQIEQVLVNVLKNAHESIGEDGAITLRLGDQGRPFLSIEDSGPGIPEDVRALLFTPFFSTKRNGRGLGLTLVQEILSAHGFEFSLGTGEGGGAEFRVGF